MTQETHSCNIINTIKLLALPLHIPDVPVSNLIPEAIHPERIFVIILVPQVTVWMLQNSKILDVTMIQ
jgi:hypothetical protein